MHSPQLAALVQVEFPRLARFLAAPFLKVLEEARECFAGDMDKVMIALAVGVRTFEDPAFARLSHEELIGGEIEVLPGLGTNVRSIAESIRMPRETVRRKVKELVDSGFLARRHQVLYLTGSGYRSVATARAALERMVVLHHEAVASAMRGLAAQAGLEDPADGL